MTDSSEG